MYGFPGTKGSMDVVGQAIWPVTAVPSYGTVTPLIPLASFGFNRVTPAATTRGQLDAVPFILGKTATLVAIATGVGTAVAGSLARVGIYAADSTSYAPSILLYSSSEFDCSTTTGIRKDSLVNIVLTAGVVYWAARLCGGSADPILEQLGNTSGIRDFGSSLIGTEEGANYNNIFSWIRVAQTYGTLPSTFPSGAARQQNNTAPFVWGRFA
jgi:hypothetical protein